MTATKQQPIAGYRISDPSDPTIKPWLSETPDDNGYTSEPLYAGAAPVAVARWGVAAWMTPEGDRVVTAETMDGARKDGGASLSSLRPYTVALVRAGEPAAAAPALEAPAAPVRQPLTGQEIINRFDFLEGVVNEHYYLKIVKVAEGIQADALAAAPKAPAAPVGDEREAFEAWIKRDGGDLSTFGSGQNRHYNNSAVNNAWTGWSSRAKLAAPAAPAVDALSQAARDVLAERRRQVEAEGYDTEHDDAHVMGEIGALAALYLMPDGARDWDTTSTTYGATLGQALLPEDWTMPTMGEDRRRDLVKGVACGLAELERWDRASAQTNGGNAT